MIEPTGDFRFYFSYTDAKGNRHTGTEIVYGPTQEQAEENLREDHAQEKDLKILSVWKDCGSHWESI